MIPNKAGVLGANPFDFTQPLPQPPPSKVTLLSPSPNPSFVADTLGASGSGQHTRPWMPKMEFPLFDGSDVRVWIDKC